MKLNQRFYDNPDVVQVARNLIGKVLCTQFSDETKYGIITETEAYAGKTDRASHAYGGRYTNRTKTMYQRGGVAYIYLCYGMHHLFNVVTNLEGIPHAVLIRAIFNIEKFLPAANQFEFRDLKLVSGPGRLSKAMGINSSMNGVNLMGNEIWLEDFGLTFLDAEIENTPRIGVDYAGDDALLKYRFLLK